MASGKGDTGARFILPVDPRGFQDPKYWDKFFTSRTAAFEWYGSFLESADILCKYIKEKDDILVIGSGNSEMSAEMYYFGLKKITNLDISQVVVDHMAKKYEKDCPEMKFIKEDVTQMTTIPDESFSVVLDKATFDALVADESAVSTENAVKICNEVDRVLRWGGRYICISLAQKHVMVQLVVNMANKGYAVRAHVINVQATENPCDVVFCFVFTKMKPGCPLICDMQLSSSEKLSRAEDLHQFLRRLREHQYTQTLARCLKLGRYDAVEGEHMKIFSNDRAVHKYNLYPFKPNVKKPDFPVACFIIPPGRSKSYLYGTHEGRKEVAEKNISAHLVMFVEVVQPSDGKFSFDVVKEDITPHLKNLTPANLFEKTVFITDGSFPETDMVIPGDEMVFEGESETTGPYRVVQSRVPGMKDFERRLVFLDHPNVIQTEMRIKKADSDGNKNVIFNKEYLPSDYQRCIVAALLNHNKLCGTDPQKCRILLIGLGGGVLTSYIHHNFPTAFIEAVELDAALVKIAIDFFGLTIDERCAVHVGDGVDYLHQAMISKEHYDVIIVDADTKNAKLPLRCPPAAFVSQQMLRIMSALLDPNGMVAINILTRQATIADTLKNGILNIFGNLVYCVGLSDELNSVAVALERSNFFPVESDQSGINVKMDPNHALDHWVINLRKFNHLMDERSGEILMDGNFWWRRVEVSLTLPFITGNTNTSDETSGLELTEKKP